MTTHTLNEERTIQVGQMLNDIVDNMEKPDDYPTHEDFKRDWFHTVADQATTLAKEISTDDRKPFSEVFGDKPNKARPEVTLRRMKIKEQQAAGTRVDDNVGIYWGGELVGFLSFDDLFDERGNRFYND